MQLHLQLAHCCIHVAQQFAAPQIDLLRQRVASCLHIVHSLTIRFQLNHQVLSAITANEQTSTLKCLNRKSTHTNTHLHRIRGARSLFLQIRNFLAHQKHPIEAHLFRCRFARRSPCLAAICGRRRPLRLLRYRHHIVQTRQAVVDERRVPKLIVVLQQCGQQLVAECGHERAVVVECAVGVAQFVVQWLEVGLAVEMDRDRCLIVRKCWHYIDWTFIQFIISILCETTVD